MATSYPLTLPTATGIRSVTLRSINAVSYQRSPFTFAGQSQAFAGQMWGAEVSLPPMKRSDASAWISFLNSLRGSYGTFLMGDPSAASALGEAGGTPVVNGADQTGEDLIIDGCTVSQTDWLKAGDYIQLGSGSTSTLHQVLADVDTDASGNATLSLWPHVRTAPDDDATVTVSSPVGLWRLSGAQREHTVNEALEFGINFSAMEAI